MLLIHCVFNTVKKTPLSKHPVNEKHAAILATFKLCY